MQSLLVLGSGLVAIAMRSSRPPRTVALAMVYAWIDSRNDAGAAREP